MRPMTRREPKDVSGRRDPAIVAIGDVARARRIGDRLRAGKPVRADDVVWLLQQLHETRTALRQALNLVREAGSGKKPRGTK